MYTAQQRYNMKNNGVTWDISDNWKVKSEEPERERLTTSTKGKKQWPYQISQSQWEDGIICIKMRG